MSDFLTDMIEMQDAATAVRAGVPVESALSSDVDDDFIMMGGDTTMTEEPVKRGWSDRFARDIDEGSNIFSRVAKTAIAEDPRLLSQLDPSTFETVQGALGLVNPMAYADQAIVNPLNTVLSGMGVDYRFATFAQMTGAPTLSQSFVSAVAGSPLGNEVLNKAGRTSLEDSPAYQAFVEMEPGKRAKALQDLKMALHAEKYIDVEIYAERGVGSGGTVLKEMADPSSFLPVGAGFKAGAAIGAGIGLTDESLRGFTEEGELNPTAMVMSGLLLAGFGGLLGHFTKPATDAVNSIVSQNVSRNLDTTADDILVAMTGETAEGVVKKAMSRLEAEEVATAINQTFKTGAGKAYKTQIDSAVGVLAGKSRLTPEDVIKNISLTLTRHEKKLSKHQVNSLHRTRDTLIAQQMNRAKLPERILKVPTRVSSKGLGPASQKMDEMERNLLDSVTAENRAITEEFLATIPRELSEEVLKARQQGNVVTAATDSPVNQNYVESLSPNAKTPYHNDEELVLAAARGQANYASSTLHKDELISPTAQKIHIATGDGGEVAPSGAWHNAWRAVKVYKWAQDPMYYLDNLGTPGRKIAAMIRRQEETVALVLQTRLTSLTKAFKGISKGSESDLKVERYLRGIAPIESLTVLERAAAKEVRIQQRDALDAAHNAGLIDTQDYLLYKSQGNTYLNRVYNQNYLDTKKGREHFRDVLVGHAFKSSVSANKALGALLGNKGKIWKDKDLKGVQANKDGTYSLTPESFDFIYRMKDMADIGANPNVFKARKIPTELEEKLEPFMVHNTHAVVEKYLQEVHTAISRRHWYGKDGKYVAKYFADMEKSMPEEAAGARQIYYTAIGSPESHTIAQILETSHKHKVLKTLSAIESTNLVLAQVANVLQATLNGTLLIARMSGSGAEPIRVLYKGLKEIMTKEGREWAEATGAAYQGTMMQLLGELGGVASEFTTAFLKGTGFTVIEKYQRLLGANMGRAMLENISENAAKLLIKQQKTGISTREMKKLARYQDQLAEMGINPNVGVDINAKFPALAIPVEEIQRGAQWFSNTVNFTASKAHKPLITNTPWAKAVYMFKSYALWQNSFLKKNVVEPLIRDKNPWPIIILASLGYAGVPRDMLSKWIAGDWEEYELLSAAGYIGAYLSVGGAGLAGDMVSGLARGDKGALGRMVLGPIPTDFWKVTGGTFTSVGKGLESGDWGMDELRREMTSFLVPGAFGKGASEYLVDDMEPSYIRDIKRSME